MPGRTFNGGDYRYGFNGKENDDETGTQDYGMRIYNPALGKFLSSDPLTREYPELTPYQFASNTPIQAIDLDGLEAVKVDLTARVTFIAVTVAVSVNVVAAPDGIAIFFTPEGGLGAGIGGGVGLSVGYYPSVQKASDLGGWGASVGGTFFGNGGDVGISVQQNENGTPVDTKIGGAAAVPKVGVGLGVEGHFSGGYAFQVTETLTWKEINTALAAIAKGLGIDQSELQKAVDKAKEEQLKMTQPEVKKPIETKKTETNVKKEDKTKSTNTTKDTKTNTQQKKKSDAPKDKGKAKPILG
jgi:RHS repeat-associated protein